MRKTSTSHAVSQGKPPSVKKLFFLLSFSFFACLAYVCCDLFKLPLFTYYPAVDEYVFGFAKMTESQGPAMYWYGWIVNASLFATIAALITTALPLSSKMTKYIAHLLWLAVWGLLPVLINSLNYYWTHV